MSAQEESRTAPDQPLRVPVPRQRSLTRADLAAQLEDVRGRRVVLVDLDGRAWREFRAWGGVEVRPVGFQPDVTTHPFLPVVSEEGWWRAALQGVEPRVTWWPAGAAWVEDADASAAIG